MAPKSVQQLQIAVQMAQATATCAATMAAGAAATAAAALQHMEHCCCCAALTALLMAQMEAMEARIKELELLLEAHRGAREERA